MLYCWNIARILIKYIICRPFDVTVSSSTRRILPFAVYNKESLAFVLVKFTMSKNILRFLCEDLQQKFRKGLKFSKARHR